MNNKNKIQELQTLENIWKDKKSKKEKWTITNQEIWLVENGEKIKLMGKSESSYKEILSLGEEAEKKN